MAPTLDAKNVTKFNVMRSSHLLNFSTWFRRLSICDIEGHIQFQFFVNQALRESLDGSARDAKSLAYVGRVVNTGCCRTGRQIS